MKNYSILWQKKRSQLRVDGDPNSDWLQMRSVLDHQMPSSGLIKKPYNPGGLKWMYKFFIGLSITTSVSGVTYLSMSKKQHDPSITVSVKESRAIAGPTTNTKAVMLKGTGNPIKGKDHPSTSKPATKAALTPQPKVNKTHTLLIKDSLRKKQEHIHANESRRRDSISLPINQTAPRFGVDSIGNISKPLKAVSLNYKTIQRSASDSIKQQKKRKRSKIGVFL